jgi:uncharacterized protein (DUF849 family)
VWRAGRRRFDGRHVTVRLLPGEVQTDATAPQTIPGGALNGGRAPDEHPAVPRTPEELAEAPRASAAAGAQALHVHPHDADGAETLAAEPSAAAIGAIRAACPGPPVSLSTSAGIEPDPERRLALVAGWTVLPELVTASQGEQGIAQLCEHLIARGVGIEAGLLSVADAEAFVESGLAERCTRALVEPLDANADEAVRHAAEIEAVLADAGVTLQQVHHGDGLASWPVSRRALERGHGIRTGLEDTTVLPDGSRAPDNAALVRVAAELMTIERGGAG